MTDNNYALRSWKGPVSQNFLMDHVLDLWKQLKQGLMTIFINARFNTSDGHLKPIAFKHYLKFLNLLIDRSPNIDILTFEDLIFQQIVLEFLITTLS